MTVSSPVETTPTAPADTGTTNSDVNVSTPAPSNGDEGVKAEGSMLDAVKAALKPADGEGSPASQVKGSTTADGSETPDPAKAEKDAAASEELTDEDLKSLKPKTAKAIERFRTQVGGLKTEVEALTPKAQEFDKLVGFIQRNNLTTQDIDTGFEVMALMRQNPEQALAKLTPIVQQLQTMLGEVLPADLQERVRMGYISETDARDLNRARSREKLTRTRADEDRAQADEQRETERRQGIVRDVTSTITEWEKSQKASDPDWHLKAQRIDQLVRLEVYEKGYPQTKAAALEMVKTIYDTVTKEVRKFVPKPQEKQVVAGGSSSQTVAEPKSLLEAIRLGMSK